MLARGALCRLAAGVPNQAAHDLPKLAARVQRARCSFALPLRTLPRAPQLQRRSYATQDAHEPSATVKKAVKAKAAAGESVNKTTPATPNKTAAKKTGTKKAAPKKARKKKKKAAPKKKPVKKAKKTLTPEQREKQTVAELRKLALKEPVTRNRLSAFNVFIASKLQGTTRQHETMGANAVAWKDITPAEREHWNHTAAARNEAKAAEYKAWVESHTPDTIRIANNARAALRRRLPASPASGRSPPHTQPIADARAVKRPMSAWLFFLTERSNSTDFDGLRVPDRTRLVAAEWKALGSTEKQRFEDQAAAEKQRFAREHAALGEP